RGERLRVGKTLGHGRLMIETLVFILERSNQGEDRQAGLVSLHPAGGERPAVVDAINGERDRLVNGAGTKEVAVHRVDGPIIRHGPHGGKEGLGENLPSEHPTERRPLAVTGEDVFARSRTRVSQVQGGEQRVQRSSHAISCGSGASSRPEYPTAAV